MEAPKSFDRIRFLDDTAVVLPAEVSLGASLNALSCSPQLKQFLKERFERKSGERFSLSQLSALIAMSLDDYSKINHLRGRATSELHEILSPLIDALTNHHFGRMKKEMMTEVENALMSG